jgi:hypothetical protein
MKAEFDAFFLDGISKYSPALQTYIPTILALLSTEVLWSDMHQELANTSRLVLYSFAESVMEYDNIRKLDSTLLGLTTQYVTIDTSFFTLFRDKCRAGEYYVCDRSYLALVIRIVGIICPK